jgi:hypothetical protein
MYCCNYIVNGGAITVMDGYQNIFILVNGRFVMAKVQKSTDSSSLAEVVDRILDKGIVIDAWVKVSLVGIELLSIEARVVIASVETYLKYAEAIGLTASAAAPA